MRFGVFLAPYHSDLRQNPYLNIEDDIRLAVWLDQLGYDEVWFGEHHSAGSELYVSPELMIATAAERTRHIRLGSAAISVPYHHPFNTAGRAAYLDFITRGRAIFGFGPGSLASDIYMHGAEPKDIRRMLDEGIGAIVKLLRSREPVTMETEWFKMRDAFLQIPPYSNIEIATTAAITPSGPTLAAKYGLSMLSMGATMLEGFDMLAAHWQVYEEQSRARQVTADRKSWRLVGPMHIARTREQAREDMAYGLELWVNYMLTLGNFPMPREVIAMRHDYRKLADAANECGFAVIGTPDDACRQIERLQKQSGGFGTYLFTGHNWADVEATRRSFDLAARFVFPVFQGTAQPRNDSFDWFKANRDMLSGGSRKATESTMAKYASENPSYTQVLDKAATAYATFKRALSDSDAKGSGDQATHTGSGDKTG